MDTILNAAKQLGLNPRDLLLYGDSMAKVRLHRLPEKHHLPKGKLVLVSAINPTRSGEGKTTVSIGLAQGMKRHTNSVALALREPSLGPIFGIKGGGTGGGRCQLEPSTSINMHFTGDIHAIGAAHNLLAALVDNDIHFRGELDLEHRQIFWRRVLDMNDRVLRHTVIGLGGNTNGVPREASFDITAASEVMAIISLASDLPDLKERISRILVGFDRNGDPITADKLQATGAMAALLRDAYLPNLVQSTEGVPAFVHGGPFGNIAHGCNSVIATKTAANQAEYVVTEAGFGFDLGAEKFFDIKCRASGLWPSAVVLVVTIRALRIHGSKNGKEERETEDLNRGLLHLEHHVESVRAFGFEPVIAINVFEEDTEAELAIIEQSCHSRALACARITAFTDGGEGADELAKLVIDSAKANQPPKRYLYELQDTPEEKIASVATTIYGAKRVTFSRTAKAQLRQISCLGYDKLPICIAKNHLSLSGDPKWLGHPTDFVFPIEQIRVAAGAGYLLALSSNIVTMPGLPRNPAAFGIQLTDDGEILGI